MSKTIKNFKNEPVHKRWEGYHSTDNPVFLGSAPNSSNPDEMCDMYLRLSENSLNHMEFEIATLSQRNGQEDFRSMRNSSLGDIDCEKLTEAIKNPEKIDSLDNDHKALYLAIAGGYLPAPKEFVFGNSYIKDREYKLSIASSETTDSFHKLPDFYVFENEQEAEKFCEPGVGIYEKRTAINEYHLQVIASRLRLDSELKDTYKEITDQKEDKLNKFYDSVMNQYLLSNKDDVIAEIRNNTNAVRIEPKGLKSFVNEKVSLLAKKPELLDSMMGGTPCFNAAMGYINDNFPKRLPLSLLTEDVRDLITDKYKLESITTSICTKASFDLMEWDRGLNTDGESMDKWLSEPQNSAKVIKQLLSNHSQHKNKDNQNTFG